MARSVAARIAGISTDSVTVHVTLLGGGFGRRLEVDYVAQAVRVAMDCGGVPVQLSWPREEDQTHDFYRLMQVAMLRATVDPQGHVGIKSAGDAIAPRWLARSMPVLPGRLDTPDKTTAQGLFDLPYAIAGQKRVHVATRMGIPVGFWRSVGHSHNAFFLESFIDELAAEARQDPVEFRLGCATDQLSRLSVDETGASAVGETALVESEMAPGGAGEPVVNARG